MKVAGNQVVVEFPEETPGSRAEAARLAEKAGKRASEGDYEVYDNARNLYVRVQARFAERQQSEVFKCVENEKTVRVRPF